MANPGLLPSPCGEGPGGRCPAARGLVPVVGFAGAPVEGASVIQQLSCYGVLADSHLTSPRSTQRSGPPPLPCTDKRKCPFAACHRRFAAGLRGRSAQYMITRLVVRSGLARYDTFCSHVR